MSEQQAGDAGDQLSDPYPDVGHDAGVTPPYVRADGPGAGSSPSADDEAGGVPAAGEGAAPGRMRVTDDGRGFIFNPTPRDVEVDDTGALGQAVQVMGDDGRRYLAEYTRDDNGDPRVRYAVTVIEKKVPYEQRWTRGLLDSVEDQTARQYSSLYPPLNPDDPTSQRGASDAPDDDPVHGVGIESWWRGYFTEAEVERARAQDNTRSVTYETRFEPI